MPLPPDFAKCGGSRREVESSAKMAAVPVMGCQDVLGGDRSLKRHLDRGDFARDNFETNLRHL